jgi:hypothetical protein
MPSPIGVIQRCLVMHQAPELLPLGPLDLVLAVPVACRCELHGFRSPHGSVRGAYRWSGGQIDELLGQGNPALAALLATKD